MESAPGFSSQFKVEINKFLAKKLTDTWLKTEIVNGKAYPTIQRQTRSQTQRRTLLQRRRNPKRVGTQLQNRLVFHRQILLQTQRLNRRRKRFSPRIHMKKFQLKLAPQPSELVHTCEINTSTSVKISRIST